LSHYIEKTKETICVFCAFSRFKENPHLDIKEIRTKAEEISDDIDQILIEDLVFVETLQENVVEIKKNQKNEENKINYIFNHYFSILQQRKEEILENLHEHFNKNKEQVSSKLNFLTRKMEDTVSLKDMLSDQSDIETNLPTINNKYNDIYKRHIEQKASNCELTECKFISEDPYEFKQLLHSNTKLVNKKKKINLSILNKNVHKDAKEFSEGPVSEEAQQKTSILVHSNNFSPKYLDDILRQDFSMTDNKYDKHDAFEKKYQSRLNKDREINISTIELSTGGSPKNYKSSLDNSMIYLERNPYSSKLFLLNIRVKKC